MLGRASQDSRGEPQSIGPFCTGENAARGRIEGAQPGIPPTRKDSNPFRDCTSPGLRTGAVWVPNGATSQEKTLSEPPARSRTEVLGLD